MQFRFADFGAGLAFEGSLLGTGVAGQAFGAFGGLALFGAQFSEVVQAFAEGAFVGGLVAQVEGELLFVAALDHGRGVVEAEFLEAEALL